MDLKQCSWPIIEALIDQVQDAVFIIKEHKLIYVNRQLAELLDTPEEMLLLQTPYDFIHPDDRQRVVDRHAQRLQGEAVALEYPLRVFGKGGAIRTVHARVDLIEDEDGAHLTLGTLKDISDTLAYQRDLEASQKEIMNILNNLPDIFYRTDAEGKVIYISPSIEEALGYKPEEVYGRALSEFYLDPSDRERILVALREGGGVAKHVEAWLKHKDGTPVWVSTNAYIRLDDEGKVLGVEGMSRDITERKRLEEQLEHIANHDSLTQLPTRRWLMHMLQHQVELAKRNGSKFGILFCDLDGFKEINDRYTHRCGDEVLFNVAQALKSGIRASDIVGRLGGDEFLVIAPELSNSADAESLGDKIIAAIESMQMPDGIEQRLGVSIGVAIYPDHAENDDELLSLADEAMYRSKSAGRNRYTFSQSA